MIDRTVDETTFTAHVQPALDLVDTYSYAQSAFDLADTYSDASNATLN